VTLDLVQPIRTALIDVLSQGTWCDIQADHERVALAWRDDLSPGSGKPKYVGRVLAQVGDDDVVALARRCLHTLPDRSEPVVQDALWAYEADGVQRLSAITRRAIVDDLKGRRMHADHTPTEFLSRFARPHGHGVAAFEYVEDGSLVRRGDSLDAMLAIFSPLAPSPAPVPATHHEIFDAFGYLSWPDQRVFRVLEALVHPTTRTGTEQREWVDRINGRLAADGFELREVDRMSGHPIHGARARRLGTHGRPKNLIFASSGPKPELGFNDAIDNHVVILSNAEHCLIYDEPVGDDGLTWPDLVVWWATIRDQDPGREETRKALGRRLKASTASPPEQRLFVEYFRCFADRLGQHLPALLPQVYLHYDPATLRQLRQRNLERRFLVQRMDFLMLLPGGVRVVLEVDGQQHYATSMEADARPSPRIYAETAQSDRELRLAGYEVYRFGGHELSEARGTETARAFFEGLFRRHRLLT
jgi:very-short-patch-repair endonuclease